MGNLFELLLTAMISAVVAWCVVRWFIRSSRVWDSLLVRHLEVWSGDQKLKAQLGTKDGGGFLWLYSDHMPRMRLSTSRIDFTGIGEHIGPGLDESKEDPAYLVVRAEFGVDKDGAAVLRLWDHYEPTDWPKIRSRSELRAGRHGDASFRLGWGLGIEAPGGDQVKVIGWPVGPPKDAG